MLDHQPIAEAFEVYDPKSREVHSLPHRGPAAIVVADIRSAPGHEVGRFGVMEDALRFIAEESTRIDAADSRRLGLIVSRP